jgi:metal-responsive CopG/Arc/MetJ family transcriptional regulator
MTKSKGKGRKSAMPRASVSLPVDIYSTLEQIAHEKKVSLAWVLRDAAEKYIADKWPLFRGQALGSAEGQRLE